jgi:hypothetical protein
MKVRSKVCVDLLLELEVDLLELRRRAGLASVEVAVGEVDADARVVLLSDTPSITGRSALLSEWTRTARVKLGCLWT